MRMLKQRVRIWMIRSVTVTMVMGMKMRRRLRKGMRMQAMTLMGMTEMKLDMIERMKVEENEGQKKRRIGQRARGGGEERQDLREQSVALAHCPVPPTLPALVEALGAEAGAVASQVVAVAPAHAAEVLPGRRARREVDPAVTSQTLLQRVVSPADPARVPPHAAEGNALAVHAAVVASAHPALVEDDGAVGDAIAGVGQRLDREDGEMAGCTRHRLPAHVAHAQPQHAPVVPRIQENAGEDVLCPPCPVVVHGRRKLGDARADQQRVRQVRNVRFNLVAVPPRAHLPVAPQQRPLLLKPLLPSLEVPHGRGVGSPHDGEQVNAGLLLKLVPGGEGLHPGHPAPLRILEVGHADLDVADSEGRLGEDEGGGGGKCYNLRVGLKGGGAERGPELARKVVLDEVPPGVEEQGFDVLLEGPGRVARELRRLEQQAHT
eukprot:756809-Hanusia_phi.AAC.5